MKLLGIDLGERRVGFALCDTELPLALAHTVREVKSSADVLRVILEEIEVIGADRVIIGLPLEMSGKAGKKAREAESYKQQLEAEGVDAELFDERLSSAAAHSAMKSVNINRKNRMKTVDAISAQLILQSYLDVNF